MKRSTDTRKSTAEVRANMQKHYGELTDMVADPKASADFRRPAYPNYTVEDALKKWRVDTKKGVDAGGEDRREQREE